MDRLGAKGMKEQAIKMVPLGKMGTKRESTELHCIYTFEDNGVCA
jgi:hypothetical protein